MTDKVLLAFDHGQKSIGVAIGQTVTKTAKALTAIKAANGTPNWKQIQALIDTWQPHAIIVGIPLNMDDSPQNTTAAAKSFAMSLKSRFHIPVHLIDERLTTVEAKNQLFKEKGYNGLSKSAVDALSAKLILESYMTQL